MDTRSLLLGTAILALSLSMSAPALAQDIDFGDDSSTWANDGQCDDPRFEGPGAAPFRTSVDLMRDATDCQTLFEAGEVTLVESAAPATPEDEPGDDEAPSEEAADDEANNDDAAGDAPAADDIDFGDDSGRWANDGECDDPRFGGALESHRLADASDCRAAFEAGDVTYLGEDAQTEAEPDAPAQPAPAEAEGEIDFGDDSGTFANDGECDDPRFGGALTSHEGADATDCREAYEAGEVTYLGSSDAETVEDGEIDFGDDSGHWANDGECDDPRFGGGLENHRFADASDCRAAYEAGEVTYLGEDGGAPAEPVEPIIIDGIDFGDDSGNWARDGECDDPRFTGSGMGVALDDHLMADATDCSTAYQEGTVTLADDSETGGNGDTTGFRINFGDDSGSSAHDGICDDPRFQGRGAAAELYDANLMADATDCRAAYEAGTVTYEP